MNITKTKDKILLVEDDRVDQIAFERLARQADFPYDYVVASSVAQARSVLESEHFTVAVIDYFLGDGTAFDLFELLEGTPFIIVTATGSEEIAVSAMKQGAYDYLTKDPEGNYLATLSITVENVIKQKRMENDLAHYQRQLEEQAIELRRINTELARASHLKDEFLANMSHELRTPLNSVLGLTEVLEQQIYGDLNAKQREVVRNIEASGRHLLQLITDILDLSKVSVGKLELNIIPVSVEYICQTSLTFVNQMARKKQISVQFTHDSAVKIIQADELRLKQILVNLLTNAIKFTPEGGEIGLIVASKTDHQIVSFTVWDTGIGIARNDLEYLFQPFMRVENEFSRQQQGTGLGLSLVARLVDLHGGSVTVESEVGKGSRFIVSFPWHGIVLPENTFERSSQAQVSISQAKILPESRSSQPISPKVLIAEDHELTRTILADYLVSKGYQAIMAANGRDTLECLHADPPDIVVMDIQMPEVNGLEVIRQIRKDQQFNTLPIIAVTALAMPGDREKCLSAGADEYISKPLRFATLQERIDQLLIQQRTQ